MILLELILRKAEASVRCLLVDSNLTLSSVSTSFMKTSLNSFLSSFLPPFLPSSLSYSSSGIMLIPMNINRNRQLLMSLRISWSSGEDRQVTNYNAAEFCHDRGTHKLPEGSLNGDSTHVGSGKAYRRRRCIS